MRLSRYGQLLSGWPRRLLALAFLVLAAASAVHSSGPTASASVSIEVVTATRNLAAGATIGGDDVRLSPWPVSLRPASAIATTTNAVGRRLAAAIGTGEVLTTSRLIGSDLTAGLPAGMIAVPVPLVDAGAASLVRAGDHVNLLSPPSDPAQLAKVVASGVLVLAVIPGDPSGAGANGQLVVAVDQSAELRIAQVITVPMLATVIKPP